MTVEADTARDWRAFDRAELRGALGTRHGDRCETQLGIDSMHCAGCAARIEKLLLEVDALAIQLASKTISFRWNPKTVPLSELLARLDRAGFTPTVLAGEPGADAERRAARRSIARIGVATICAMQVMMLAWPGYWGAVPDAGLDRLLRVAQWLLATPAVLWAGFPFFRSAWAALRERLLNMDVPVALALATAYGASSLRVFGDGELYFDTATMFVWFLLLGRHFEARTRRLAGERLRRLMSRRALTAQCLDGDRVRTVPIDTLAIGDTVLVPPGEALPVDGIALDDAELDESLLSGESTPLAHRAGDELPAGALNLGRAPLRLRALRIGDDTTLAQITRLLDGAQAAKPRVQRVADRIAGHFTLGVLLLAAAGFAFGLPGGLDPALDITLAVMVASCPCALSLAVPVALAAATSRLAGLGVLVSRADAIMRLPQIDRVLVDKTGTLTRNAFELCRVETLGSLEPDPCLRRVAALEQGSRHPLAQALADVAEPLPVSAVRHTPGVGVSGLIEGCRYTLGAAERAGCAPTEDAGLTWVALSGPDGPLARLGLRATLREEAGAFLDTMSARQLPVELLTGDSAESAEALARALPLAGVHARQTPQQKLQQLQRAQARGQRVLAIGDGINDAPFLAAADVSAAMPQGAALAQSRADLILVGDSLLGIPTALDIAAQARRRVAENLGWALVYNLTVLPLAFAGLLPPWLAAAGMSLSSLVVVGNALRLRTPPGSGATARHA